MIDREKHPFYDYLCNHEELVRKGLRKCEPGTADHIMFENLLGLTMQEIEEYRDTVGLPLSKTARLNSSTN